MYFTHLPMLCIFLNTLFGYTIADGVLGCGGFVKSEFDLNYSLVEVKLYTPHGTIKYQTDCAPNNGYYLIPLYDKGDFVLKVEPPKGWTFEPESIDLHIDGSTDPCSKSEDINFVFKGFSVIGKVLSKGSDTSPAGVKLSLRNVNSAEVLQTTVTEAGGSYKFSKLLPGQYVVQASHPRWVFDKSEATVSINQDNGHASDDIIISGYDVRGTVYSEGEPIRGVQFILFVKQGNIKKQDVKDCQTGAITGFTHNEKTQPLCHTLSKEDGTFLYPVLPPGDYIVIPFYKGEHIMFDVVPSRLEFTVKDGSVKLKAPFKVAGFSVSGKVFDSPKGKGLSGIKVLINNQHQTITGKDGSYHLENMKTGSYTIKLIGNKIYFDETSVRVTPNTPWLPDIHATSFSVCGKVIIDKFPEGVPQVMGKRRVTVVDETKRTDVVMVMTAQDGTFCTRVKPGKYIIKVVLTETEVQAGLHLAPSERLVTVVATPIEDIVFSQFRAKVSGTVICMEKCGVIEVSLDSVGRADQKQVIQVTETAKGGSFQFVDVLPGKYKVTLLQDAWCWKEKVIDFEVTDKDLASLGFSQTGYILKCILSHAISLNFAHERKEGSVGSFQLNKGTNRFCLAQPGVYKLTPDSCHQFEQQVYTYDTSNPRTLTLTAVKHLMKGTLKTEQPSNDIMINIKSLLETESALILGPLTPKDVDTTTERKPGQPPRPIGPPYIYQFSHWSKTGEKLHIVPKSHELLFFPESIDVFIQGDLCPGEVATFMGKRGIFIHGKITPAISGVNVTIFKMDTPSSDHILMETNAQGKFMAGPLHPGIEYGVNAEKTGYILEAIEGKLGEFKAFKLGEISVKVLGEDGTALQMVLLSLSGGTDYRSNNLTDAGGSMLFSSLSPGQYFLRPMMKEYRFDPASKMIDVQEGSTVAIEMKGYRVAFSCYGLVTSLNGEPETGVVVEAVGMSAMCDGLQEETKTESDGVFRIRGLQPQCSYNILVKREHVNQHLERATPKVYSIEVTTGDIKDIRFIVFRKINSMDISGNIVTTQEHLSTLTIHLFRADNTDAAIHTVSMAISTFFYLPSLPIDGQTYLLKLETSLRPNMYGYTLPREEFLANTTYRHFTFTFQPQRKSLEQDLNQGSFLILPLTILIGIAFYNHQKLMPYIKQALSQLPSLASVLPSSVQTVADYTMAATGDVASIAKKKVKVRKT